MQMTLTAASGGRLAGTYEARFTPIDAMSGEVVASLGNGTGLSLQLSISGVLTCPLNGLATASGNGLSGLYSMGPDCRDHETGVFSLVKE
jgi:hypothetical protein